MYTIRFYVKSIVLVLHYLKVPSFGNRCSYYFYCSLLHSLSWLVSVLIWVSFRLHFQATDSSKKGYLFHNYTVVLLNVCILSFIFQILDISSNSFPKNVCCLEWPVVDPEKIDKGDTKQRIFFVYLLAYLKLRYIYKRAHKRYIKSLLR